MADCSNVADVLKRFATKITTSSVKERQKILSDLLPCVRKKEVAEPAVKGILRVLLMTLSRYNDRRSRLAVEAVLAALANDYFDSLCSNFVTVVGDVAELQKRAVPCVSTSAAALNALGWLSIVMRIGYRTKDAMKGDTFTKLVEIQSSLVYGALASQKPRLAVGAYRRLKRTWKEVEGSVDCYAEVLMKLDSSPHHLCLVGYMLKYLSVIKQKEKLKQYKSYFLNQYVKLVVVSRTKPALHLLVSCRELVRYVTRDEFKEILLPAIDRAMLRNPEIILRVVSELLAGLTVDVSPYAVDIGKHLATQCHSKDEVARKTAAEASERLARLCSECEAVEKLIRHFFDILSGATVKLTVVEQRLGMLSGIGGLSSHTVSGTVSVQSLAGTVTACFIPILQQEGKSHGASSPSYSRRQEGKSQGASSPSYSRRVSHRVLHPHPAAGGYVTGYFIPILQQEGMLQGTSSPTYSSREGNSQGTSSPTYSRRVSHMELHPSYSRRVSHRVLHPHPTAGGYVTGYFIPILQQEVHEGTLVMALATLSLWCAKFTTEVPTKLTEWFKKGIGLKMSTSAVRNAYIQCMSAAFHGDTLIQGMSLLPVLLQVVEKANSQPTQVPLATEALSASCLLLKLSVADIQAESKLSPLWNVLLDTNKQLFVNDKFLASASDSALCSVATMVEKLVLDHPHKMDDANSRPYYRALVFSLTHGSYPTRRHAQTSTKKILAALGGAKIAIAILRQFQTVLASQKLVDPDVETINGFTEGTGDKYISPRVLTEAITTLASVPAPDVAEAEMIAMETLLDAHHPCIVHYDQDVWTNIVGRLKIDAADFVAGHIDDILRDMKNSDTVTLQLQNTVSTLARVSPSSALPKIVAYVEELLSSPALLTVTMEEVAIMNYPEGQLYNTSVIKSTDQQDNKVANMKRENKLYSYAEQLAEIELKKELEKKKKGKKEEPKLTKRQQEAVEAELQKESELRARIMQFDHRVTNAYALIDACCQGNAAMLRLHLPAILKVIVSLFPSTLAASHMTKIFVELHQCAFTDANEYFGFLVAYSTLRLLKPSCDLEVTWTEEPLRKQLERVIDQIHSETASAMSGEKEPFSAPTFAYCFYLLRAVLQDGGASVGGDEEVMVKALDVLEAHTKLRSNSTTTGVDENGPELLPREAMLKLSMNVIGVNVGKMQQMAASCLVGTAACASGLAGCAMAEQCEVEVLLASLLSVVALVRESAIQGLLAMVQVLPSPEVDKDSGLDLVRRVWIARFDIETEIVALADGLWEEAELTLDPEICSMIVSEDVIHDESVIRDAASRALVAALGANRGYSEAILKQLLALYEEKLFMPPPVLDNFGRPIGDTAPDQWLARCGIATAIGSISPHLGKTQILPLFRFFVDKGLGDRNEEVGRQMLAAAVAALNEHGKTCVSVLLPIFEDFLGQAPDTASFDVVRQSIVILMGSLAKHLDKDDPKVKPIVAKLINTLSTPSQQVQQAVADCLPPLVPAIKEGAPELVKQLLHLLLESESYGERRGAAYGLAGLVKGLGILVLKNLEIQPQLTDAIQDKKNPRRREGALFAFEMLCVMLGRLFEPYVVNILPHLLLCFGDANQYVRVAADDTAKAVMSKLSGHGVKLVLPSLLAGLEKDSWRTKTGSVELLGAMAYCAPKQLSGCLPSIVPKLAEVLTDSHIKVQKAGAQALKQIGSVIRNPEIQAIVPILLAALQDPTKKTTSCLQRLLETKFVHFIDAPSLALIMPVVQRAFLSRSTETRKMAAQIIGNMYSLTDQKDLAPYLPQVIPGLKQSLLDPVPEVRTVSAKALGAMVRGMGESGFKELEELVPWLMQTLTSEASSVDRSGAAQGLSEVVGGLGLEKLHKLMPDIIQTAERTDIAPTVRDGYIMMYIYLPAVFGDAFMSYIATIIPSILKALADESEFVRDTALRAGQRIVNTYADSAVELLLPELENGLFNDNWRIRYSSVQLLGDLLYRLSGVTGKMSTQTLSEDDNFGTEMSQQAILRVLGSERRNRVLAGLYMGRSDTALNVRQAALHVWKVVVAHTPKTLREILPTLFQLLLGCLASKSYDKRQVRHRLCCGTASSGSVVVVEGGVAEPGEIDVCAGADDDDSVSEPSIASSQTDEPDVAYDGEPRQPVTDDSCLFVQVSSLKKLVENLPCPVCQGDLTVVVIDKSKGPVVGFHTECTTCGHVCSETLSSGRIGNRGSRSPFATTRRMVAGNMDCGVGFSGLRRICWMAGFTLHPPEDICQTPETEDVRDINVSYDASWMTRGHQSYYGIGSVIDLITCLVIDYTVLSLYCHGCTTVGDHMDKNTDDYRTWKANHVCNKNFEGTAGAMDAEIAEILWRHSEQRHGFRYITVLSDGDAKKYNHLVSLNVYGDDCQVTKEECVNHVSKRMGTALRKVAAEGQQEGVVTGGRGHGKLTAAAITELTKYYGNAIRSHPDDLDGMRTAVFATFLHALSTDDDPHHDRCPAGISSWCFYQRAVAKGERPGPHEDNVGTPLSRKVGRFVKPVYVRLGDENLLSHCLRVKTQNPNESLHSVIWRKCLKTDFLGKLHVEAGAAIAVSEFNQGTEKTVADTTVALGFQLGEAQVKLTRTKDRERTAMLQRKADAQEKKNRERRRLHRIRQQDMLTQAEGGPSYASGEF
ncbi:eIF-2-alpha kinase activator GCN1 [Lamellibrachia satsuma]|nr:eIF-2-alpha kinase activator GCN1 [Lamellibrachia satsuma]